MSDLAQKLIHECKETQSKFLNLGNCGLSELPKELFDCVWLEELNLGEYFYSDFEQGFDKDKLVKANYQELSKNNYLHATMPDGLKRSFLLDKLRIGNPNHIWTIPEEICKLTSLKTLQIRGIMYSSEGASLQVLQGLPHLKILVSTGIVSCEVFATLPHLEMLTLDNGFIEDIDGLGELTRLKHLSLTNTNLEDVSVLGALPHLESLVLSENGRRDDLIFPDVFPCLESLEFDHFNYLSDRPANFDFLSSMPQLKHLRLRTSSLSGNDINQIQNLHCLESLDLQDNNFENLDFLSLCPQLQHLNVSGNQLQFLEISTDLAELQSLNLYRNEVGLLDLMVDLPKLKTLDAGSNRLVDMNFLLAMPRLESLNLSGNELTNIYIFREMPDLPLKHVALGMNLITDFSLLSRFSQLQNLSLWDSKITNLDFLRNLHQLECLELASNQVSNLEALSGLTRMKVLKLEANQINSMAPLSGLTALEYLDLFQNQVSDFTGLSSLVGLQYLELSYNQITDLRQLPMLAELQYLGLAKNAITNIEELKKLPELIHLNLENNPIDITLIEQNMYAKGVRTEWGYCNRSGSPAAGESAQAIKLIEACQTAKSTSLDLGQCGLSHLPEALYECTWLEELNLSNTATINKGVSNRINLIPKQFQQLKLLKKLNLSGCLCPGINEEVKGLEDLANLEELDLSNNKLGYVTPLGTLPKLRILNLSYNNLTSINLWQTSVDNLEELDLCGNMIWDDKDLKRLTCLTKIILSDGTVQNRIG